MNIKHTFTALLLSAAAISGCITAAREHKAEVPTLTPLTYGKTYTLQNKSITVIIAPDIGRIIHFGFIGNPNLIWLNDTASLAQEKADGSKWLNWGGDKIWPARQADWRFIYGGEDWPPKTELDGKPFLIIESSDRKLIMESATDTKLHLKLRRTLTIDDDSPELTIKNQLLQLEQTPWPVHIWSVTQCLLPQYTLLGISKEAPDRDTRPFSNLWDTPLTPDNAKLTDNALRLSLTPDLTIAKAGTVGSWCAAVYHDAILLQKSDSPPGGCYPDGANVEVFLCSGYTELEILCPNRHLQPGESMTSITTWRLIKTAPQASTEENMKLIENFVPFK